jgi:hypothetical protein
MFDAGFAVRVDASRIDVRLGELAPAVKRAVVDVTRLFVDEVRSLAQTFAAGEVLHVITGRFVASIKGSVRVGEDKVTGKVHSRDERAGIFEWGGTTRPHEILPVNARALAFMGPSSGQVFATVVHHPGSHIAKHSTIHAAFDGLKDQIREGIVDAGKAAAARV